jgi:DNA-directed RNA polymerase specialized sigma24 family protein
MTSDKFKVLFEKNYRHFINHSRKFSRIEVENGHIQDEYQDSPDYIDAVHDVFLRTIQHAHKLNTEADLKSYVFKSISNRHLELWRNKKVNVELSEEGNEQICFNEAFLDSDDPDFGEFDNLTGDISLEDLSEKLRRKIF